MDKKFAGSFVALMKMGGDYCNQQRFWGLRGAGKPLWEFKEHDHRLFCHRYVVQASKSIQVFLLCGWVKDKRGRTGKEDREIEKAKALYEEFLLEYPGGHI